MQKKLIVLAIAGAMSAPMAAQAGVEVYGKAIVSIEANDHGGQDGSATVLHTNQSRIGFKGSEALDNGMTFVWQWENYVNFDTGGWGGMKVDNGDAGDSEDNKLKIKGRNTYVGLRGDFGTFLAGRYDTPYKLAVTNLDPFKDLSADFNSIMGVSKKKFKHADRLENLLVYVSPEMGGFQFLGAYMLDETRDGKSDDALSLAAIYALGDLKLSAAYQVANEVGYKDAGGKVGDDSAMQVGVGYKLGYTDLSFVYEVTDSGADGSSGTDKDTDRGTFFFAVKHKIGKTTLALSYIDVDSYGSSSDTGATQATLGVFQKLSKNTKLYALYSAIDNDKKAYFDLYAPTGVDDTLMGSDPSTFAIGIISKFSSL